MDNYIAVPKGLTRSMLEDEFGIQAVEFYMARIADRQREGRKYYNPLKFTRRKWGFSSKNYGKTWLAYRHKPKEVLYETN